MDAFGDLLGKHPSIARLRAEVRRLLQHPTRRLPPVLVLGETGTGKGLLARTMHKLSTRAGGPFVSVNCAALPETLLEAELFGFERGAFTDARKAKDGLFQSAHRGTLFLDEIGAMPFTLQAKLLTAIEDHAVRRLGSTRSESVDLWIIAATSEDLPSAARDRRFRPDLYHRLSAITLSLPPLRDRGADVLLLAEHCLAAACRDCGVAPKRLTPDAEEALLAYSWPGNVRELANVMERVAVLVEDTEVVGCHLALSENRGPDPPGRGDQNRPLKNVLGELEREQLRSALEAVQGNLSQAAARLGMPRNTLRYRLSKYGLLEQAPEGRGRALENRRPSTVETHSVTLLWVTIDASAEFVATSRGAEVLELIHEKIRIFGGSLEDAGSRGILAIFGLAQSEDPQGAAVHAALAIRRAMQPLQTSGAGVRMKAVIHVADCRLRSDGLGLDTDAREVAEADLTELARDAEGDAILLSQAVMPLLRGRFPVARSAPRQSTTVPIAVVTPTPAISGKPSIAVLSFQNLTGDTGQDYFGEGITEDITAALSRLRWVFVIARSSAAAFKTTLDTDRRKIAGELGVRYLLTGTVRNVNDQLRVTAQLEDVEAQTTIWAERYDGARSEIFDFQERITGRIVATLDAKVRSAEIERALQKRPDSLDAYDCVLRALSLSHRLFSPEFFRAEELLERAIALDPNFAAAYAWRSWWYLLKIGEGLSSDTEADIQAAHHFAEAALERDPDDAVALAVSGHAASFHRAYDRAIRRFERALAINPNCAFAWGLSGTTLCYVGEPAVALDRALYALRLSPFDLFAFYFAGIAGLAEMLLGHYEQAVAWAMKSRAEKPRYSANLRKLAACLAHLGRLDEAREVGREFLALQTGFTLSTFARRYPLRDPVALECYVEDLRKAGLPE